MEITGQGKSLLELTLPLFILLLLALLFSFFLFLESSPRYRGIDLFQSRFEIGDILVFF